MGNETHSSTVHQNRLNNRLNYFLIFLTFSEMLGSVHGTRSCRYSFYFTATC